MLMRPVTPLQVLPNGEVVRTGMDALPGSNCGQSYQVCSNTL